MSTAVVSNPRSFHLEAAWQRCCQAPRCDRTGRFHAHHVVPKQLLRRLHLPQYDTRGALRVCWTCHMQFERAGPGKIDLPVTCWRQVNVCYVFEVLGLTVVQLEGKYGTILEVPRYAVHLDGRCEHCQST